MVVWINEGINPALHLAAVGDSSSPDGFDLEHRPERTAIDPERKVVNLERTDQRPEGEFLSDVVPHMFGELHGGGVVTPSIFGIRRFAEANIPPIPNGTHNFFGVKIRSQSCFPNIGVYSDQVTVGGAGSPSNHTSKAARHPSPPPARPRRVLRQFPQ